jgi:PAS domain S-box-containing protein
MTQVSVPASGVRSPEADHSEVLDRISDGVISVDAAWRYTYANRRAGEILGVDPALLVGRYLWDLFPAGPEQPFYDACSEAMATRTPIHAAIYHAELDLWFEHHLYPAEHGLSIIFQDITARRSAEDAVERQREMVGAAAAGQPLAAALTTLTLSFERGLSGALCSIVLLDEDGVHLRRGAAPSLPDELNALLDGLSIGPDVGPCGIAAFRKQPVFLADIESESPSDSFRQLARRLGLRACWSSPILGADGVVLGIFAVYAQQPRLPSAREQRLIADASRLAQLVIERQRSEAERERLLAELAAERSLLAAVLDHLPCAVLIAEAPSGRLIRGNARVEAIAGHPIHYSESTESYQADWLTHDPEGRRIGLNAGPLARAIREGTTTHGAELRVARPDGSQMWVRASAAPIRDREGHITGGVMTAEDISAEKALERQLRQAQRLEVVGRLAGGIAHDFNNLLTVIQANADLTLDDLPEGHPAIESIEEVLTAAERATHVTRQLLAFSRKQVLIPTQLDLDAVLNDAEKRLRELLPAAIALTSTPARESIGVRADRAQLEQVLLNLVVNARDALPDGGTIAMTIGRELVGAGVLWEQEPVRPGEYARISVHDDGTGMDEATRARIFEPFFTTKPVGAGTGLGLSTVYGIVRQSEGWIRVESEVGRGTTISVLLPLVSGRPPSGSKEAAARSEQRGTELVLLVEDEPLVRSSTRRVLQRQGYRVIEAQHGVEALGLWEARRDEIDLVLTDVMMPELGGLELASRLRALDPRVRVIFMSGYLGDDATTEGPGAAREPFLQKPFSADALARRVRTALDTPPR